MITNEQQAANQANAQSSTGPKTKAGKALVSRNAVQHGLRGNFQLIVGESPAEFQTYHSRLQAQLAPHGALEEMFAERVIAAAWRLRRILRMETEMTDKVLENALRAKKGEYQTRLNPIDTIFDTELESPEHNTNSISLGKAIGRQILSNDIIGKLHRYEAHIERGLHRSLHELQRLQATRQGQVVPVPLAVDISTDQNQDIGG